MNNQHSIFHLAIAGVQGLVPYQPGKPISELERELGIENIVKLASNENPLGPSEQALDAIQAALPELARYPDGNGFALKNALAEKLAVIPAQITLGNGSNELLELLARTFLSASSEVVFSRHAFAVYPLVTQAAGATAKIAKAKNHGHDLDAMRALINADTRIVFIANPNNPTGTYLPGRELLDFVQGLPEHVVCVLDEAYYEYVQKQDYPDSLAWLDDCPNLIITRSFSKAYGLAGLRIGYSLSSPEMAELLSRVRQPFNNNALALAAAEAALKDAQHLQHTLEMNAAGMQQLMEGFTELGLEWIPSVGNFISVDLRRPGEPVYQALLRRGVIVRPVANYQLPKHLRISIGREQENRLFLDALRDVLNDVQ